MKVLLEPPKGKLYHCTWRWGTHIQGKIC